MANCNCHPAHIETAYCLCLVYSLICINQIYLTNYVISYYSLLFLLNLSWGTELKFPAMELFLFHSVFHEFCFIIVDSLLVSVLTF